MFVYKLLSSVHLQTCEFIHRKSEFARPVKYCVFSIPVLFQFFEQSQSNIMYAGTERGTESLKI